jgi:hypothetical protein
LYLRRTYGRSKRGSQVQVFVFSVERRNALIFMLLITWKLLDQMGFFPQGGKPHLNNFLFFKNLLKILFLV